jgi:hypothetical protein
MTIQELDTNYMKGYSHMATRPKTAVKTVAKKAASKAKTITIKQSDYDTLKEYEKWIIHYFESEQGWQVCRTWARKFPKLVSFIKTKKEEMEAKRAEALAKKYSANVKATLGAAKTPEEIAKALLKNRSLCRTLLYAD